MEGISSFSPI